jgi:secondary thiamine-phosphate synthase enzyme
MKSFPVSTRRRTEMVAITSEGERVVRESGVRTGVCVVFVPHTTAGVTINENADPDVVRDMDAALEKAIPWRANYAHSEGNAAAHVKASLMGSSGNVPVEEGRLVLGTWQGIYFCEFYGPRERRVHVQILPGEAGS